MKILENDNPLLALVSSLKNICTKKLNVSDETYRYGDLIYDKKNSEYGMFLGIKPPDIDILGSPKVLDSYVETIIKKPKAVTAILLTLSKSKPEGELVTEKYIFRIRYTSSKYLQKVIPDDKIGLKSDLEKFCSEICFISCSRDCPLWKYYGGCIK